MTTTPPDAPSGPAPGADHGPRVTRDDVRDLSRLRRTVDDRKVAGVAGGIARHLDIDPLVVRVTFVVTAFFGAGLIFYGACWLLLPEEGSPRRPFGLDDRSRAVALIIGGVIAALTLMGNTWSGVWYPWPLVLIALAVLFFLTRKNRRSAVPPAAGPTPYAAPYADPDAAPHTAPHEATSPAPYTAQYAVPPSAPQYSDIRWVPPASTVAPVRPWPPKRRGPILFWFTLALIALAEGTLGIVDVAGPHVVPSAYPALAVAITGVMLLVGAFFGRAGGLILVGLIGAAALAGTTAAGEFDGTQLHPTPTSSVALPDGYEISNGEVVLDLRQVRDLGALDGRTIFLDAKFGRIEVIVPPGLSTSVTARVHGPGDIQLFGEESGGIDVQMSRTHEAARQGAPQLTIDAELSVGSIEVHQ